MKKVFALLLISFVAVSCLFAVNWFTFSLNLSIIRACQPMFWSPGTTTEIENSSVNIIPLVGTASFASLGIAYKGTLTVSIDVGYSPFYRLETVNNESSLNTSDAHEYSMSFRQPDSDSAFVFGQGCGEINSMTSAHYGSQVEFDMYRLLNNVNPANIGTPTAANDGTSLVKVCDFYVDSLDLSNASSGEYLSLLICQVTVE